MRGITIRVDRAEAMRVLGAAMRTKAADFEREKATFPKRLADAKKRAIAKTAERLKAIRACNDGDRLNSLLSDDIIPWNKRDIPRRPILTLCREKQLLLMLQQDVRKVVPINSNHDLWAILQGQCETLQ